METYKSITVTVSNPGSGNRYYFDTKLSPIMVINRQRKYVFNQSDSTNDSHQIYLSETYDGLHNVVNGYIVGKEYLNGVEYYLDGLKVRREVYIDNTTFNAATTREVHWRVADDAPRRMYPVCRNHPGMWESTAYFNLDPTDEAHYQMIQRVANQAPTANAQEVSNLAKTLNNIESTVSDQDTSWQSKNYEKHDAGPEVTWSHKDAEFVVWAARHHHSHDGGGGETYDSNLDVLNTRKYMGFHCYDGTDGGYTCHGWKTRQLYHWGQCHWFYRTSSYDSRCYSNTTYMTTELGHPNLNIGPDSSPAHYYHSHDNWVRFKESTRIGSWEVRDNRYYVSQDGNQIHLKDRWGVGANGTGQPISSKHYTHAIGRFAGSSYNRKRKEAVVMGGAFTPNYLRNDGNSVISRRDDVHTPLGMEEYGIQMDSNVFGTFKFIFWHDVPFITGNTNLNQALNDNNRKTYFASWYFGYAWRDSHKIVLTDDGSVFAMSAGHGTGATLARFYRSNNNKALRYQHMGWQYGNSNIGSEDNSDDYKGLGVRVIQSRNKRNVVLFSDYHDGLGGSLGWVITRDFNRAQGDVIYNQHTSHGCQIGPFRDGDFYHHSCMDWNDSDYTKGGNSIIHQDGRGWFRRYPVGTFLDGQGNTTNYEFMCPIITMD